MTDDGYPDPGTGAEQGPNRTRLILGGGLAVVLLAVIGASGGWILAGEAEPITPPASGVTTPTPSGDATPKVSASPPQQRPTAVRTTTAGGLTVPELVGTDFVRARQELRDRKLGWRLVFGTGSGRGVERTSPEPGTPVRRGITVTLWVAGPAPALPVPDLVAQECGDAADDLVEAGFYPSYRTLRRGPVTAQEPEPGATAHWNDKVTLTCGDEPPTDPEASPPVTP
ncbi:PASTA domain-containing protein [Micromonospora eburnea]|uniref:PASTA domain-containing protein n=1 Tax=Micromonospora eburnea TaxID=227316 RepID=A0A1C6VRL3_9ACTN|nr:PASTA domain-containing protein [Micromonospora eburnea]SCL68560.1 PASTA domain-containing protein [Micromonospora eburnea]